MQVSKSESISNEKIEMSQEDSNWGRLSCLVKLLENLKLKESSYTFGRGEECGLINLAVLTKKNAHSISKKHFTISRELGPGHRIDPLPVYIEDFSQFGTYVNGELIGRGNRRILAPNDRISILQPQYEIYKFNDYLWLPQYLTLPAIITKKYFTSVIAIGSGNFGKVYKAHEFRTCKTFAIKQMRPTLRTSAATTKDDNTDGARDDAESEMMRVLHHPNIIKLVEVVPDVGGKCIIMELAEGGTLTKRIDANGYLPEKLAKFYSQKCFTRKTTCDEPFHKRLYTICST